MTKTVCDICGKDMPLEINSRDTNNYNFCILSYGKMWDVCQECRDKLYVWIRKQKSFISICSILLASSVGNTIIIL